MYKIYKIFTQTYCGINGDQVCLLHGGHNHLHHEVFESRSNPSLELQFGNAVLLLHIISILVAAAAVDVRALVHHHHSVSH